MTVAIDLKSEYVMCWFGREVWRAFLPAGTCLRRSREVVRERSGRASFVSMMQAPDLWKCDHRTVGGGLYGSWRWRIFRQREVGPGAVIVGQVSGEGAPEMRFIQDDHVIEALAPNGSDQAFDIGILPRTRRARDDLTNAHAGDPSRNRSP